MNRLKAIFGIGMTAVMVMASMLPISAATETDYTSKTITMARAEGKYKTQGRTGMVGTGLSMDWTGAGIEFNADCEGSIKLNMKVQASWHHAYITAIIDGKRFSRIEAKTKTSNMEDVQLEIASKLTKGKHSICVYNETESPYATMSVESIELSGQMIDPPKNNNMLIEFIGDSYFAGWGNMVENTDDSVDLNDTPLVSDGAQAMSVLTANKLNADYSVMAISGYGLVAGFADGTNLPKYYDYISWQRSHTTAPEDQWNFSRPADIVVVELGDNDDGFSSNNGVTVEKFTAEAKNFLQRIRSKNKNAKIVWVMYAYEKELRSVVEELGGAEAGLYTTTLALGNSGAFGHPNVEEGYAAADALSKYLTDTIISPVPSTSATTKATTAVSETTTSKTTTSTDSTTASTTALTTEDTSAVDTSSTTAPDANTTAITSDSASSPKTGDSFQYVILWIIGFGALAVLSALALCKKKATMNN